ncbi:MAG TPA: ATP-dependent DNA ligase, partial [Mycobacteriales bacterium]
MDLPVLPPIKPMLAQSVATIPDGMLYEPKWDGFRTIVFKDGDEIELGSRSTKPLTRYFPEVVEALRAALPDRCVVDGETVLPVGERLDFEALLQRVHPAASRVRRLSAETPCHFVAFDILALGDDALLGTPFSERRAALAAALRPRPDVHLTPQTEDRALAEQWFAQFEGAGLDGVVAKPADVRYVPDKRLMKKIKHSRTADVVVAGYRVHKSGSGVGSLLLGIYDSAGFLQHVGVVGALPMDRRLELEQELQPLVTASGSAHPGTAWAGQEGERVPGGAQSRWQQGKDLSFVPLDPVLVAEVAYEHMEGTRFRHTAQLRHFRPDREPESCTYDQLDEPVSYDLAKV